MPQSSRWPHRPTKLSDLIDSETLSVLISGSCTRLGRALTVLDYDRETDQLGRIDPMAPRQNFAPLCDLLRNEKRVRGGNAACEACDERRARQVLREWREGDCSQPSTYSCHVGMVDYSQIICVSEAPVGVMLAGQFAPNGQAEMVHSGIETIAWGRRSDLQFLDALVAPELHALLKTTERPQTEFARKFAQEAMHIQMVANAYHHRQKADTEGHFLDELRNLRRYSDKHDLCIIREDAERLLRVVREYCGCQYIVLFTNISERDTVLSPLAQVGFDAGVNTPSGGSLPHFNWTKAGLALNSDREWRSFIPQGDPVMTRGIRGENVTQLSNATCAVATVLGSAYRGVMLFGPFAALANVQSERDFLFEVNRIIGWSVFAQVQALRLHNEQERLLATTQLLQHRFRTALTPITTHVTRAKLQLDRRQYDTALRPVTEQIKAAKEICLQIGKSAGETARSAVVMVEHDDLKFDLYPLSVLVANCAEGFVQRAADKGRELQIEQNIESLPYAEVDIARLTIAISNLLDNAVKYSYPSTRITVRAGLPSAADQHHALVSIQNLGDAIPPDKMEKIFERGERGLAEAKMGKIEGTGYGLWEAKAIIAAHRGTITVTCEETNFQSRQGRGYRVTFVVRLPLRQNVGH